MNENNTDINLNNDDSQKSDDISEELEIIHKEKSRNNLLNLLLIVLLLLIIYYLTNVLVVKDEFLCIKTNPECSYKSYGILNNTKFKKEFLRGKYSLYVLDLPDKRGNGEKKEVYIITFSKDDEIEVTPETFKMFEEAAYDNSTTINKTKYREKEMYLCLIMLVLLFTGIISLVRINRKKIIRKEEVRTIEIERD